MSIHRGFAKRNVIRVVVMHSFLYWSFSQSTSITTCVPETYRSRRFHLQLKQKIVLNDRNNIYVIIIYRLILVYIVSNTPAIKLYYL